MPNQIEPNTNNVLGDLLRGMMPGCHILSENTQTFPDYPGRHADVLITAPGRSPVVVEAEYAPAPDAEKDARERLGLRVAGEPRTIEAAVALRYPQSVDKAYDLRQSLAEARLSFCVVYEGGARFPASGWLDGPVTYLADLVRLVSVPQKAVDAAADMLQDGIDSAAAVLNQMPDSRPDISPAIARRLNMTDVPQMRRMACAIIANAMLFHERLAGRHGIKPLRQVAGPGVGSPQAEILDAWDNILKFNYLDIFDVAKAIVAELPSQEGAQILNIIGFQVLQIAESAVNNDHDLTGQVFQRLIADRKYLATFYTRPASAALLARLAVAKLQGVNWADADAISRLRVGDFACGTGSLLSAVYEQIAGRHERAGGDAAVLHPAMMEEVMYGCDVMPSAIHITGSTLAGLQPGVGFRASNLETLLYGRQPDGSVAIGSLELLDTDSEPSNAMPDGSFDLVIMNPPFTRNVTREGATADAVAAAFAAFGASETDQRDMAKRMGGLKGNAPCYHGNAGIASAFAALADRKLKPGGVLALVLPLSAASGLAWQGFRQMLAAEYNYLTVLSIAAADNDHLSFSSDTGMAECLVIARKLRQTETATRVADFVSLEHRAQGFAHASALATGIASSDYTRRIEDGPYGGTPLIVGDELAGGRIIAPCHADGTAWGTVRLSDLSLAQTAHALSDSRLWLPASPSAVELKVARLNAVSKLGMYHLDIIGPPPRGPFVKGAASPTATYPSLWNHDAKKETRIVCEPDSSLQVRHGMEGKAATIWATASRSHLNLDFRFNSQPLGAAITEQRGIGGRAWPNVIFDDQQFDFAFTVWENSTLGLLMHWWHSNRQVAGRGTTTISAAGTLPVLDFRTLSDGQLATAEAIFEEFRDLELKPAYLADADPNRARLDRRVVCDLLGFDEEVYRGVRRLAAKWCAEPSVHGGKARPKGAKLEM